MADSWWDSLLNRMFGPQGSYAASVANEGQAVQAFSAKVGAELDRQERAGNPPAPTPTTATPAPTTATQQPQNPNLREGERLQQSINTAVGAVQKDNPLYGNIPQGYAWLGSKRVERGGAGSEKFVKEDTFASIQEVMAQVNEWSVKKRQKFAELAVDAGLLKEPTINYDDLESVLGQLAVRSAKMFERGIRATPWSLLERYAKSGSIAGSKVAGPITTTTVNRSVDITSPRDANALVDAALQQRLGRSPTEKEKKEFLAALNATEKKDPKVTKTTTTTTGSGTENVSSNTSTTSSGGVNTANFAREWSMSHNKDEAGSYQALSYYMPLFYQALEAPV